MCFPCNQFLSQEPNQPTPESATRYSQGSLTLDDFRKPDAGEDPRILMMETVHVNGANMHPVYHFLKYNSRLYNEKTHKLGNIMWNFGSKFLIDRSGGVYSVIAGPANSVADLSVGITAIVDVACACSRRPSTRSLMGEEHHGTPAPSVA